MYVDHRLPYDGDHGIRFEVVDSEHARRQLQTVRVVAPARGRPNDLDRRVATVLAWIPFHDAEHHRRFSLAVAQAELFESLPLADQQLIWEAEGRMQQAQQTQTAPIHLHERY
jgi:hypothetical protein